MGTDWPRTSGTPCLATCRPNPVTMQRGELPKRSHPRRIRNSDSTPTSAERQRLTRLIPRCRSAQRSGWRRPTFWRDFRGPMGFDRPHRQHRLSSVVLCASRPTPAAYAPCSCCCARNGTLWIPESGQCDARSAAACGPRAHQRRFGAVHRPWSWALTTSFCAHVKVSDQNVVGNNRPCSGLTL